MVCFVFTGRRQSHCVGAGFQPAPLLGRQIRRRKLKTNRLGKGSSESKLANSWTGGLKTCPTPERSIPQNKPNRSWIVMRFQEYWLFNMKSGGLESRAYNR